MSDQKGWKKRRRAHPAARESVEPIAVSPPVAQQPIVKQEVPAPIVNQALAKVVEAIETDSPLALSESPPSIAVPDKPKEKSRINIAALAQEFQVQAAIVNATASTPKALPPRPMAGLKLQTREPVGSTAEMLAIPSTQGITRLDVAPVGSTGRTELLLKIGGGVLAILFLGVCLYFLDGAYRGGLGSPDVVKKFDSGRF